MARINAYKYLFPALLILVDAGLTLLGQPEAYWSDYSKGDEMFPVLGALLAIHPTLFLAAALGWIVVVCLLIRITPDWPSLVISISFMIGHFIGCLSWLLYAFRIPFFFLFLLIPLLSIAIVLTVCKEQFPKKT